MSITAYIEKIGQNEPKLYYLLSKADRFVYSELSKLIEEEQISSQLKLQFLGKEELQEKIFLLYERANKQLTIAKNKGKIYLWQTWQQIVNILDLVCEYLEDNTEDDFYLLY